MKLKELLQTWLTKYAKPTLKVRSFNKYQSLVYLHASPVIGEYDIKDITSDIIQDYLIEKLKSGNLITQKPLASKYSL